MPQENIQLSVPDMQCSGCENSVSKAIQQKILEKSPGTTVEIKINSLEKRIDITITANKELDKNKLTLEIKNAIVTITGKNAYTMGCDLEVTTEELDKLPCTPDKWFLIKPSQLNREWKLFQVDALGKTKNAISISDVPGLAATLQQEPFNEDKIRDDLFLFQMNSRNKLQAKAIRTYWSKALLSMGLSLALFILSLCGAAPFVYLIAGVISTGFTLYIGWETYYQAFQALYFTKQLTIDSLFTVSTLTTLIVSLVAVFCPSLGWHAMFDMAPLIFGFKYFGVALVETKINQSTMTAKFSDSIPLYHQVDVEGQPPRKTVRDLKPGDIILVKPGKCIPVDGEACEDFAVVSTLSHHGDINPIEKKAGDVVHAGMLIHGNDMAASPYRIKVTQAAENSYLMKLDRDDNAQITSFAENNINYIVPLIFLLALGAGVLFGYYFPLLKAIQLTLSLLISFCPCTLGLVNTLSTLSAVEKLQEKKMTVKNNDFFAKVEKNSIVAFDLIGTLTSGKHEVLRIQLNSTIPPVQLKNIIYTLEKNQEHSVSRAICQSLENENPQIKKFENIKVNRRFHMGISASIDGFVYIIGNDKMMKEHGIPIVEPSNEEKTESAPVTQVIYIARKKEPEDAANPAELLGSFQLTDPLRPEAIPTLSRLQAMGKKLAIFTGASQSTLNQYLAMLKKAGIDIQNTKAECVNKESEKKDNCLIKKEVVLQAKEKDKNLMMIGEGENDALVMQHAGIGIALESDSQSSVTQSKAQIIIPALDSLLTLFSVVNLKATNEKQNRSIVIIFNIIAMMLPTILMISGCSLFPVISLATLFISLSVVMTNNERFKRQVVPEPSISIPKSMTTPALLANKLGKPTLTPKPSVFLTNDQEEKQKQKAQQGPHPKETSCLQYLAAPFIKRS